MIIQICNLALMKSGLEGITEDDYWITLTDAGVESIDYQPSIPQYEAVSVPGRSSPPAYYSGGSPTTFSLSVTLHRDMVNEGKPDVFDNLVTMWEGGSNYDWNNPNEPARCNYNYSPMLDNSKDDSVVKFLTNAKDYSKYQAITGTQMGRVISTFDRLLYKIIALNYPVYTEKGIVPPFVYVRVGEQIRLKGYCQSSLSFQRPINSNRFMLVRANFTFTEVVDIAFSADEALQKSVKSYKNIRNSTGLTASTTGFWRYIRWHEPQAGS